VVTARVWFGDDVHLGREELLKSGERERERGCVRCAAGMIGEH
jgi:hypothetical protein